MGNPYHYINAINAGEDLTKKEFDEKEYLPFITNRQFSYFQDTALFANEMNQNHHLDNKSQFSFYINIIRPRKRFSKWSKTEHHDDLEAVVQYFDYSYEKAKVVMDILSAEDVNNIKKKLSKGGLKK
jgi:methyltransferase-like protein